MSTLYLTKTKLAAMLPCTKRTLTNYVADGVLPAPERRGRDAGWSINTLRQFLCREPGMGDVLSEGHRNRLILALDELERLAEVQSNQAENTASEYVIGCQRPPLPGPILVDKNRNPDYDLRAPHLDRLKATRGVMDLIANDARKAKNCSHEKSELWNQVDEGRAEVHHEQLILQDRFLYSHSSFQLIGNRRFFASPLFNVRNQNKPRSVRIELSLPLNGEITVCYEGPELRQDDGLVFMALLNIARDVRLGKAVGFSAQDVCLALWGYYDGPVRARLKKMISRLQEAILRFPTFRVQLVQRFDFPDKGLWSVCLDEDIVKLFPSKKEVVWLDLNQRLSLSSGLASWLYGYIRCQSLLIITKVEQLRHLSGSGGELDGFRSNLITSMGVLASARLVCPGWHIDRHDCLHWLKDSV